MPVDSLEEGRAVATEAHPKRMLTQVNVERAEAAVRRDPLEEQYLRLWQEFGPSIERLAASYEALAHAREDLLQNIRLAIWLALARFRGEASLRTFVFRIAHNRALTHVWKRKRLPSPERIDELEVTDRRADPAVAAMRKSDGERLLAALRQLPLPMRQVMTLTLEELPHAEIAAILGITENNVAVRLDRARALLRGTLGDKA